MKTGASAPVFLLFLFDGKRIVFSQISIVFFSLRWYNKQNYVLEEL